MVKTAFVFCSNCRSAFALSLTPRSTRPVGAERTLAAAKIRSKKAKDKGRMTVLRLRDALRTTHISLRQGLANVSQVAVQFFFIPN